MVGDEHRRRVGPPARFDIMGAHQFGVMVALGLREEHYLLDIGAGCLRGSRFFVVYLRTGRYHAIEPDKELWYAGMAHEFSQVLWDQRLGYVDHNDSFTLDTFGLGFDFLLAQSIVTHTSPEQTRTLFERAAGVLLPTGTFVLSYLEGVRDNDQRGWDESAVPYREATLRGWANHVGLSFEVLHYKHPNGLIWARLQHGG